MNVRTIMIVNGTTIVDSQEELDNTKLASLIDEFCVKYNVKEVTNDSEFSHYLSDDKCSFLGVYFL